jgi:hypothetical protein
MTTTAHPVQFSVDYPDRSLNRTSTAFRVLAALPVLAVLAAVSGSAWEWSGGGGTAIAGAGGVLFLGPLLMLLFRGTYPRWWFDFNLELERFTNRVVAYLALLDDRYPSATDRQAVHLEYPEPENLSRWKPLVKWFLAIPHYVVLAVLFVGAVVGVVVAWFAILITGRYPRPIFDYVTGVLRWSNRVTGYAFTLVTDRYPPFSLR